MIKLIRWLRRSMYRNARVLGDVQAVATGRVAHRYIQRQTGKLARRAINKALRGIR